MMTKKAYFVIDFDSTFTQVEALDELGKISLKGRPDRDNSLGEIQLITSRSMDGEIAFSSGLKRRLELLQANRDHLPRLIRRLKKNVSTSIKRNREFFQNHADDILIISNGFREFIEPVVADYKIKPNNIYANAFAYDKNGNITGFDESNVLSRDNGKVHLLKNLNLKNDVYVIGDGHTDYEIKAAGLAKRFYAFTENAKRDQVVQKADHEAPNLDEFLYVNRLPRSLSYPKNRIKVLLLENIHQNAFNALKSEQYQVELLPGALDEVELAERIKDVSILGIRSKTQVTKKVLENANKLKAIGAFCIGTNQIDLDECLEKGVVVFNAPYSNTRSVVELALGEIIMLMREVPGKSQKMHQGVWDKSSSGSHELRGKKLGIIGYGNIGSQLSVLAEALGMQVYFYDTVDKLALGNAVKCRSMKEVLRLSDVVTLHVDGRSSNRNFFGKKDFAAMKKDALFLNLSRGFIVDLEALAESIRSGRLKGAAVDVFPKEPKNNDEPFASELQDIPNVILTPHIAGSTEEAQANIAEYVPEKLISYINTGNTYGSVNFPNLQLPPLKNAHRLIHLHGNVPGILAQINNILADHNINILGQYLKTNETVGYVITDIDKKYQTSVAKSLRKIDGTTSLRVLY